MTVSSNHGIYSSYRTTVKRKLLESTPIAGRVTRSTAALPRNSQSTVLPVTVVIISQRRSQVLTPASSSLLTSTPE